VGSRGAEEQRSRGAEENNVLIIYSLLPITCHLFPLTCHLSPVTCHLFPELLTN
jgi:hypothetical protein